MSAHGLRGRMSPYLSDIHEFMHRRGVSLTEHQIIQHFSHPTSAQLDTMLEQSSFFRCRREGRNRVWTAVDLVAGYVGSKALGESLPKVASVWGLAA